MCSPPVWPIWAKSSAEQSRDICADCGWHVLLCACDSLPNLTDYRAAEGVYDDDEADCD